MPLSSPRLSSRAYGTAPLEWAAEDVREWSRRIADTANSAMNGKINSTGTFTLAVSAATTIVDEARCGPDSVILWMPTTANAGGEVGMYVTARGVETSGVRGFTVNHGTGIQADRVFVYAIFA